MSGKAYFLCQGESTADERNVFAGLHDVELTPYGRLQAERAGEALLRQGVKFNAIFVSYLKRARETCDIALEKCDPGCAIQPVLDMRLADRSFGVFAGRNQNLLKQVYGFKEFAHLLHSTAECPPSAEQIPSIYARISEFYREEIKPRLAQGENVLVASHAAVLEPLAFYLSGLEVDAYRPLNLPPGTALSEADLKEFLKRKPSKRMMLLGRVGQETSIHGTKAMLASVLLGLVVRLICRTPAPQNVMSVLLAFFLGVCVFYTFLVVDLRVSASKVPKRVGILLLANVIVRWAVVIPLVTTKVLDASQSLWGLLLLVPPGLTCSNFSILWGGNKYVAVMGSVLMAVFLPCALVGLSFAPGFYYAAKDLMMFYVVMGVGLALPASAAQAWRTIQPVESAAYKRAYGFLSTWAVVVLFGLTQFQYTPSSLVHDLLYPSGLTGNYILQDLARAVITIVAIKVTGVLTFLVATKYCRVVPDAAMDMYILLTNPNPLLWLGLAAASTIAMTEASKGAGEPVRSTKYATFWAVLFFHLIPRFEQDVIALQICRSMATTTTKVNRLSLKQLEALWVKLQGAGNDAPLDWAGVKQFAEAAQKATTGRSESVHDYVVTKLVEVLDADLSGTIDKAELFTYLSNVGLVVDLNTVTSKSSTVLKEVEASDNWWSHVMMPHSSMAKKAAQQSGAIPMSKLDQLWWRALEEQRMADPNADPDDNAMGKEGIKAFAELLQFAMSGHTVELPTDVVDRLFVVLDKNTDGTVQKEECIEWLVNAGLLTTAKDGDDAV